MMDKEFSAFAEAIGKTTAAKMDEVAVAMEDMKIDIASNGCESWELEYYGDREYPRIDAFTFEDWLVFRRKS